MNLGVLRIFCLAAVRQSVYLKNLHWITSLRNSRNLAVKASIKILTNWMVGDRFHAKNTFSMMSLVARLHSVE
jgi:hypothetical protein